MTTVRIEARGGTTWAVYRGEEFLGTVECEGDSEADADVVAAAEAAFQLIELEWKEDPDNEDGYVAQVPPDALAALKSRYLAAGYEVSDSCDEDGRTYLWVGRS